MPDHTSEHYTADHQAHDEPDTPDKEAMEAAREIFSGEPQDMYSVIDFSRIITAAYKARLENAEDDLTVVTIDRDCLRKEFANEQEKSDGYLQEIDILLAAKRELVEVVNEGLAFTAAYSGIQRGVGGPMDNALAADSADATTRKMQAFLAKHKETTDGK